jgi:hypothetical protein
MSAAGAAPTIPLGFPNPTRGSQSIACFQATATHGSLTQFAGLAFLRT